MKSHIINRLAKIVGEENVCTDPAEIFCYSRDSTPFQYFADVIVRPAKTTGVSEVMKLANENRIPVYPRGSGTSAAGSPLPVKGGILIDLTRMNQILSFDEENLQVVMEPGVICDDLNEFLKDYGYYFPPDPASSSVATIGGMVANNSAGNRAIKYGKTKDWILWLEAVLPSGEIIHTGSDTLKSVSGYDLTKLLCGSEGTLAVFTKIGMRVQPLPETYKTAMFLFDDLNRAGEAIVKARSSGVVPCAMEFLDKLTISTTADYAGLTLPDCEALLLIETDGIEAAAEKELKIITGIVKKMSPKEWKIAQDEEERNTLWVARKSAYAALARCSITTTMEDLSVPISKIPEALKRIQKIPERVGNQIRVATFGHAGDGNLHPTFLYDERISEQQEAFYKALNIIYDEVALALGGSITGEHGVGIIRKDFVEKEHGSVEMALMKGIKRVFDPSNILNPGKGKPWGSTGEP
ncbi:MAG: FAD-binding oxidoreductase [Candidatus Jordarchaeum sp.]|uniref:FAD-binding oxidoreductase n=1 Tax=Candidatus Jordarchaeum sp. TaxID=2823881 RepID=UPI00404B36E4